MRYYERDITADGVNHMNIVQGKPTIPNMNMQSCLYDLFLFLKTISLYKL